MFGNERFRHETGAFGRDGRACGRARALAAPHAPGSARTLATPSARATRRTPQRARALAVGLAAAVPAVVLAGGAGAQVPAPETCVPANPPSLTVNANCQRAHERQANALASGKEHQEKAYWTQIAGAPHPETTPIEGSATPFAADLFAVRSRNAREAIAGGAVCKDDVSPEEVEGCERVPVIYATDEDFPWREVYRSDEPGYVGGIAWIGRGRALAVGGTGTYPRREFNATGNEWTYEARVQHDLEEGAGDARAWYLHDGAWEELQNKTDPPQGFTGEDGDQLPDEMSGLSALDIWIGREQDGDEWGLAGDYGHIWEWEGGRFTGSHVDRDSPSIGAPDAEWAVVNGPVVKWVGPPTGWQTSGTSSAPLFQYRVREIRIAPDRAQKRAFAFTAGCCGPSSAAGSRRIEYLEHPGKRQAGVPADQAPPPEGRPRWIVSDQSNYGESVYSFALRPSRFYKTLDYDEPWPREHGDLTWEASEQAGGRIVASSDPQGASESTPRYVASDGDTEPTDTAIFNQPVIGNGVPDWMVGQAPPADPELRGLGVLATTVQSQIPEYGGVRPHCNSPGGGGVGGEVDSDLLYGTPRPNPPGLLWVCRAVQIQGGDTPFLDPDGPLRIRETGVQLGPSWALNAIDIPDTDGAGYAVGDRGAIVRLSAPPAESDPPTLGARRPAKLAERSPYDESRPAPAGVAGEVPALAAQSREQLSDPVMVRAGSPDGNEIGKDLPAEDVHTIVMSRDGSEGWAIGPSPEARGSPTPKGGVMTLHHYEAGQWTRCDPVGIPGIAEPAPACAALADPYTREVSLVTGKARIRLDAAARVPYEYDSDPSNDDEFEVLAVGSTLEITKEGFAQRPIPTVIRYRDGLWRLEGFEMRSSLNPGEIGPQSQFDLTATSLACTGPDECWLVGKQGSGQGGFVLRRFNGDRWIDCSNRTQTSAPLVNREACGDRGNRLAGVDAFGGLAKLSITSAGARIYLGGSRLPLPLTVGSTNSNFNPASGPPMILYKDAGPDEQWRAEGGGYDPGFDSPSAPAGIVNSIAVAQRTDGRYEGWAVGGFAGAAPGVAGAVARSYKWPLMRLDDEAGEWNPWRARDAAFDHFGPSLEESGFAGTTPSRVLALPGSGSKPGTAFMATDLTSTGLPSRLLGFNPDRERWEVAEHPGSTLPVLSETRDRARALALSPDGRGGTWAAFGTLTKFHASAGQSETYYYNYTTSPHKEVFEEVANPAGERERLTDLAGSEDGSVWAATNQGTLYRHDRATGWERIAIPGWVAGRVATSPPPANALALGPGGQGLAVGAGGRIAAISPDEVRLDDAAGTVCAPGAPVAPCGTSFDLRSVAISPDGAALVGGEKLALLWRPAGGELRKVEAPDASSFATITGIAMPAPDRAWVALDTGQLYAGIGNGQGGWSWRLENTVEVSGQDRLLTEDERGEPIALRDVAVDANRHGFAVGDHGVVLERTGDPSQPWRRVPSGVTEKLTSVTLPVGEGFGALIGGDRGLVLTLTGGEWRLARSGDQLRPDDGYVAGVALLPGTEDGQAEAWAAAAPQRSDPRTGTSQILHYSSAPEEPLLDPAGGTKPLPDVPEPTPGEISFAAFGRSDCQLVHNLMPCPPLEGGTEPEQTILRRVRDEVLERSREPGGPRFAIFTGDAYDTGGQSAIEPVEQNSRLGATAAGYGASATLSNWTGGEKYRRFNEQLADYLPDRGLPLFGAIGARDLSETRQCVFTGVSYHCADNRARPRAGENRAWRQAMAGQPAPWGGGDPAESGSLLFEPLRDSDLAIRHEDQELEDPTGGEGVEVEAEDVEAGVPEVSCCDTPLGRVNLVNEDEQTVVVRVRGEVPPPEDIQIPTGGASTHYAMDVVDQDSGEPAARLVFVDSSLGALAASDPIQQPLEPEGGQAAWLERVLCIEGSPSDTGQCTREPTQQAIVVSNTPTYSYVPASPEELAADAALFESILLRHKANVVVSGRLGWNGRYWATAPGLHEPCPGGDYIADEDAPEPGTRVCGQGPAGAPGDLGQSATAAQGQALDTVGAVGGTGLLPFVVASNAGGRFNEFAEGLGAANAKDGFWRGYAIVRLHPSGDPRRTIVEQRPVFDWVGIDANERVLGAREKLALRGVGREPLGRSGEGPTLGGGRFDEISTPAITHRFDLVLADPEEPWTPCLASNSTCAALHAKLSSLSSRAQASRSDAAAEGSQSASATATSLGSENRCDPYLCLPSNIGTIDDQTGAVQAGNGKYPDTFAVAILSVGDHVATYPVMFKRSPSFVVEPLRLSAPLPATPSAAPNPPQPPQPPSPPQPNVPQPNVPEIPAPPPVPPIAAASPPEPQPPAPPAPPPPTEQLSPLSLTLAPPGIAIATPTAVIQPPTPPVNPAPPGGARREARQRQAAAQKSGADLDKEGVSEAGDMGGDQANAPPSARGSAMVRRDRTKPEPSFSALARADQPSAWAQGALYTGALTLMAAALAAGWSRGRPTPRRHQDITPAPGWARARQRR